MTLVGTEKRGGKRRGRERERQGRADVCFKKKNAVQKESPESEGKHAPELHE